MGGQYALPNLSGDGEIRQRIKGTVVGWENIKVPAGTFNSIKIVLNGSYVNLRAGRTPPVQISLPIGTGQRFDAL